MPARVGGVPWAGPPEVGLPVPDVVDRERGGRFARRVRSRPPDSEVRRYRCGTGLWPVNGRDVVGPAPFPEKAPALEETEYAEIN